MDPATALLRAQDAIRNGDADEAREYLLAYHEWRARGGFEPALHGTRGDTFAAQLRIDMTAALAASDR